MQIKYIAMKKSILLFILVSLFTCAFAVKPVVTVNEAKQTAANFLTEQCHINAESIQLTLQYVETDENGEPLFYRFQLNNQGFVIVSASEFYHPVLAFSYESNYESSKESDAFCESYKKNIQEAKSAQVPANAGVTKAWNHFNRADFVKAKDANVNECQPLVTTNWGQKIYYNQYCPFDGRAGANDQDARTTVGSAALAMSTIINYYRYPVHGFGGVSYISENEWDETYPRIYLNFNEVIYNYDAMTSSISNYNGEVAKLLFHTGASALTNYSVESSGLYKTTTKVIDAYTAFKQYWGYSNDAQLSFRGSDVQNDSVWIAEYVLTELKERRPVFYSAYKGQEQFSRDHMCFVIDGYKYLNTSEGNTVFLHVNLAPTTTSNEMKKAFYMYTSANFKYKYGESVIRYLQPNMLSIEKPVTSESEITARAGSVSDGAGNMKYASLSNRSWLIAAPNANKYTFTFKRLNTEADNDVIRIYSGSEANEANLKYTFSGQHLTTAATDQTEGSNQQVTFDMPSLPESFTINASTVLVTFTSNDTIEDYGFVLEFTSEYDQSGISTCAESQNLTNFHNRLIDKAQSYTEDENEINNIHSGDDLYAAENICAWNIKTPGAVGYYIDFPKFDLKAGDFIEISSIGNTPELLYTFDVFNWPALATAGGYNLGAGKVKVRFVTDHWQEGEGFEMNYWAILGVNQESGLSDINIYPNPATSFLNVDLTSDAQNITVNVLDVSGKVLYNEVINHNGGTESYKVPVSDLSSGIYFLHLNTATGKSIQKFIVK